MTEEQPYDVVEQCDESAPVPTNPEVTLRRVPEQIAAAVRVAGRWSEQAHRSHLLDLENAVAAAGLAPVSPAWSARFDPPCKP